METLCLATNNAHKLDEVRAALQGNISIISLKELGCFDELPEEKDTLEGNSAQKAQYIFDKYKVSCIADDTGLLVEALGGAPGVYSARYAGPEADSEKNMALLLQNLTGIENRKAKFVTVITLVTATESKQFVGEVLGSIRSELSGNKGFGYDPIFEPEGYTKTFAEFSMEEKNTISHRGRALAKLTAYLQSL